MKDNIRLDLLSERHYSNSCSVLIRYRLLWTLRSRVLHFTSRANGVCEKCYRVEPCALMGCACNPSEMLLIAINDLYPGAPMLTSLYIVLQPKQKLPMFAVTAADQLPNLHFASALLLCSYFICGGATKHRWRYSIYEPLLRFSYMPLSSDAADETAQII